MLLDRSQPLNTSRLPPAMHTGGRVVVKTMSVRNSKRALLILLLTG